MKAPKTKTMMKEAVEGDKSDDSGISELDNTTISSLSAPSTTTTSTATTLFKVPRIGCCNERRRRMMSVFPNQSTYNKSSVSMARKLVKKALKTRLRMDANQNRRQRHMRLLEQLCQDPKDNRNEDETKKEEYEEPPPRPPTRRCMFYREDTDVVKVLRAKQC